MKLNRIIMITRYDEIIKKGDNIQFDKEQEGYNFTNMTYKH